MYLWPGSKQLTSPDLCDQLCPCPLCNTMYYAVAGDLGGEEAKIRHRGSQHAAVKHD